MYENNDIFDVEFYKSVHIDLNHMSNEQAKNHYYQFGINEKRLLSKKHFYKMYSDFDIDFYKATYTELSNYSKNMLLHHYYFYGESEGRLRNENSNLFDAYFYKSVHIDLNHFSNEEAKNHYYKYGINEKRLLSEKHFYEMYPDFDVDFYKSFHNDLRDTNYSNNQLIHHYYFYGESEGRLIKNFHKTYIDFDTKVNFRKLKFKKLSGQQILSCYYYYQVNNKKCIEFDFVVNYDYSLPFLKNKIYDLIHNHENYRKIDTNEKLIKYFKQFEKKYYIYNKESFYTYYYDFDYEYYKNKYFNNNQKDTILCNHLKENCDKNVTNIDGYSYNIKKFNEFCYEYYKNIDVLTEKDILLYYHLKGKYEKHTINNKINIVMYSPPYSNTCGGIMVMHYFCKVINEKYNDRFSAKLFMHNNITYKNPFCNHFARIDEINDNTIVIYPETVSGNPLNAKNVVRWVLLELGIEMPLDHYKNWSDTDLIYYWEPISNSKQLCCPFYNNLFTNKNLEKSDKTCYLVKKGRLIHKNIQYIHPPNSICIDDLSLKEKVNIFNECKFFYTYDPNTAYVIFSAACGCIPIIYPIENVSEEEYFKSKMFNFDNNIYNKGVVYGNNIEKINYILENKLNENNEPYYRNLFTMIEEKTFLPFLEKCKNICYTDI